MKLFTTLLFLSIFHSLLWSNCDCTNCPLPVPDNTTVTSTIPIAGASNATLGSNGQAVCQVCVHLSTQAIKELSLTLTAPDGSVVILHDTPGILGSSNVTFDICFNDCNDPVSPDPGFLSVFSDNASWPGNALYTGSYYPPNGACLSSFTGNVNGNWTLTATDDTFFDDHTILDWYIVFADPAGLNCTNAGNCSSLPTCNAFAGNLVGSNGPYCQGDAILGVEPTVDYGGVAPPPAPEYSYTYFVGDAITDVLLAVNPDVDLTSFGPGFYNICGLSYLTADAASIPSPGGGTAFSSVLAATLSGAFCGDVTTSCLQYEIVAPSNPDFDGPLLVCEGESVCYDIVNFDPTASYIYSITSGSFQSSIPKSTGDGITVVWNAGVPGQICLIEINSACGNAQDCVDVTVVPAPTVLISGGAFACIGDQASYTITPSPGPGESYTFNITGGSFVSFDGTTLVVQWNQSGTGIIEPTITGGACEDTGFISVLVQNNIPSPSFNLNTEYCENETINITGGDDASIINYIWSATNAAISSTGNQASVNFNSLGPVTICYQVETNCGLLPEVCQTTNVVPAPLPVIANTLSFCELNFMLDFTPSSSSNTFFWNYTGPGNAVFTDATIQNPSVTVDLAGSYFFTVTESNGFCIETATVQVDVADGLMISTPNIACDASEMYTLSFTILDGQAPYSVDGQVISGTTFTSTSLSSGSSYSYAVTDDAGCTAVVTGSFSCPCATDAGTMSNVPLTVCQDQLINITAPSDALLLPDDVAIFVLHDSPADALGNIISTNTTGVFTYDQAIILGQTYFVSYVVGAALTSGDLDFNDPCLSVSFGQPIVFQEIPSLTLVSDTIFCGFQGLLDVSISPASSSVNWQVLSGPGNLLIANNSASSTSVSVDQIGEYVLEANILNGLCTATRTVKLSFLGDLEYSVTENCLANATEYTVEVILLNGQPPFVSNVPGTFLGNVFTSDPISSGSSYDIRITDSNSCITELIQGIKLCECDTDAGTMSNTPLEVCIADDISITAMSNLDMILETGDSSLYVLHTSAGPTLGDIKLSNADGEFSFDPSILELDSFYYISLVAGDADLQTGVDFSDICLDIAIGQPVIWYSIPVIDIDKEVESCEELILLENRSPGGQWEIISQAMGASAALSFVNGDTSILVADQVGEYMLRYTLTNGSCTVSDTLTAIRNRAPMILTNEISCNPDLSTYSLEVTFQEVGDSYIVNGEAIAGYVYSVDTLVSNDPFQLTVSNQFGCSSIFDFDPVDCSCESDAGSISVSDTLFLCQEEIYLPDFSNFDFALLAGDTFSYVLFDALPIDPAQAITDLGDGAIVFNQSYTIGQAYYVALLVGDNLNGSLDFNDPCLAVSDPVTFIWLADSEIDFNITESYCESGTSEIVIPDINEYPVELFFESDGGQSFDVILQSDGQLVSFPVTNTDVVWTLVDAVGSCINSFSGSVNLSITDPVEIVFEDIVDQCNNPDFGATLDLNSLLPSPTIDGAWDTGAVPVQNDTVDFAGVLPGSYLFTFSTLGFEGACPGSQFGFTVTVISCDCPIPQFVPSLDLCNDEDGLIDLQVNGVDDFTVVWDVIAADGQTDIPTIVDGQLSVDGKDPGAYQLSFELEGSLASSCDSIFVVDLFVAVSANAGQAVTGSTICPDQSVIDLFEFLENYDLGGDWYQNGDLVSNPIFVSEASDTYYYKVEGDGACRADSAFVELDIYTLPEISLELADVSCYGADDGSILITVDNGSSFTALTAEGLEPINLAPNSYDIIFSSAEGCDTLLNDIIITEPEVLEVSLGDDIVLTQRDSLLLQAILNISEDQVQQVEWKDLTGVIPSQELELMLDVDGDNTITIEILDENGCRAEDQITISLESFFPNIYLPNAVGQEEENYFGVFSNQEVLIKSMEIYDRWGNQVYQVENVSSASDEAKWTGVFKGQALNPGVFVYQLAVEFLGTTKVYQGDISLIR